MERATEKDLERYVTMNLKILELFLLQFGVRIEDMEKVMKEILSGLKQVSSLHANTFYEIAIPSIHSYEDSTVNEELQKEGKKLFPYKEDEEFHLALVSLPIPLKLPFILYHFHGFSRKELSGFSNLAEDETNGAIRLAEEKLMEKLNLPPEQFTKTLEFMNKAYNRMPRLFDSTNCFFEERDSRDEESVSGHETSREDKTARIKRLAAVSLIIIFFSSLFVISATGAGQVDQQYIAKLEEEFEAKLEERRALLGVRQEIYHKQFYIVNAKSLFQLFKNDVNKKLASGSEVKRKDVKQKFQEVLDSFQLPSEMAAEVLKSPIMKDKEESLRFLESYSMRLNQVRDVFIMQINSMMTGADSEQMMKGMESQNFSSIDHTYFKSAEFKSDSKLTEQLLSSLHPTAEPYITMLQLEGKIRSTKEISPDELSDAIVVLEEILLQAPQKSYLYIQARDLYSLTFRTLLDGPSIYQKDLTIKEAYRQVWEKLAEMNETSPAGKILSGIVAEMAASGWTHSKTLKTIDSEIDLNRALALAHEGDLQEYQPTEREFESDKYMEIRLPDEKFELTVMDIYRIVERESYTESRTNFVVNPLYIVGAYDLAQREGNEKVLWYFTAKYFPIEKFQEKYETEEPVLDGVDEIIFDPDLIHYNNAIVYPILFKRNEVTEIGLWISQSGPDWTIEKIASDEGD